MEYEIEKGEIRTSIPCVNGDGEILGDIRLIAHSIRKQHTGIHASVSIRWNRNQLEGDVFNIERNEERRKLANGSWKLLPVEAKAVFPVEKLKAELDLFCDGLWQAHIGQIEIEELRPSPNRKRQGMLGPFVVDHGGTILFSQPGQGKTWLAMLIAQTINSGSTAVWQVKRHAKVLFINLERDRLAFEDRLGQINKALGLDESYPLRVLNRRGASLKDVEHAAQKYVQENGIEVVVLDSISRAGAGNLIDPTVANEIMDTLNRICPTWLAIAHAPKPQANGPANPTVLGSTMFGAAADLTLHLTSESFPDRLQISLTVGKANIKLNEREWRYMLHMEGDKLSSVRRMSLMEDCVG